MATPPVGDGLRTLSADGVVPAEGLGPTGAPSGVVPAEDHGPTGAPFEREGGDDDVYYNGCFDRSRRHRRWPHRGNLDPLAAV